ncbi:hypothetical protein Fmac_025769 [Flemingia macrophylla]|uniref:Uncharacterized protein n=1 Tax=Flemingia macrophylla TaxID=520843 RepID=A0ABD1LT53_9FABA
MAPEFVGKRTPLTDLVKRLLMKDLRRRLCYAHCAAGIKEHDFFCRGCEWRRSHHDAGLHGSVYLLGLVDGFGRHCGFIEERARLVQVGEVVAAEEIRELRSHVVGMWRIKVLRECDVYLTKRGLGGNRDGIRCSGCRGKGIFWVLLP